MKVELTVIEVLDYCDGPLLFLSQDRAGHSYICVFLQNMDTHTEYLCSSPRAELLVSFMLGDMDLRRLILGSPNDSHFLLKTTREDVELVADSIELCAVEPDLLPARGYFLSKQPHPQPTAPA